MLTTDPLYWKPYKPDIRLYTTDPSSDTLQYRYSPFTGTGTVTTGPSNSIPNHLSISLSQNTHGSFIAQFLEDSKAMEDADITVGSRIRVFCGKSSTTSFLCFGGIVREVGYDLGPDDKILYTMIGSSYGIRLNERVIYTNTQAAKLYTGELDLSDTSRKADSLLETTLAPGLNQDGLISISGLASSSDVETFIPQSIVEYGEMQDFVNLIEEGSGGTVVITPMTTGSALMQFKHENAIGGYGYAIKNKPTKETGINDDADDTMYMLAKARGFVKQFNKSNNFANRLYAIWAASEGLKTDYTLTGGFSNSNANTEDAWKFRVDHTRFVPGDLYIAGRCFMGVDAADRVLKFRIAGPDTGNSPSSLPVIVNINFDLGSFPNALDQTEEVPYAWVNDQEFFDQANGSVDSFYLDTTKYYWIIMTTRNMTTFAPSPTTAYFRWDLISALVPWWQSSGPNTSTNTSSQSGWSLVGNAGTPGFQFLRNRSHSISMWDPKSIYAVSSGLANGLFTDSVLHDVPNFINTRDQLLKHMSIQLYEQSKPRVQWDLPIVSAPNIPPFPGDAITINDTVAGHSQPGKQVMIMTAGDMTYTWGSRGGPGLEYTAPTKLKIQPVGMLSGYS